MPTTRFAPSPTGLLHQGHAFAAITAYEAAAGGDFLLRIEDLDRGRSRPEYEQAIREDLAWLRLRWHEPVLRQSERFDAYRDALEQLEMRGVLYPCFCTRKEIAQEALRASVAPHPGELSLYPGTCRALGRADRERAMGAGRPYVLRLNVTEASRQAAPLTFAESGVGPGGERGIIAVEPEVLGDIVLARKDVPVAYHLAVVIDDAFQGVSLVTRGQDLFSATHVQRLLQSLLGLPEPRYAHHRLILDAQGKKFSKRNHAATLRSLREHGISPEELRRSFNVP